MNLGILDSVGHQDQGTESSGRLTSAVTRRSLTVHRPAWQPEAPARGREPSGSPIAREGPQSNGQVRAREENLELLRAIATSRVFTEFERAFTEATGLPLVLQPVESFKLSFHDRRNQGPFCALMTQENRTCGACLRSQSQVAHASMEHPHTTVCYAGLCETVVPLRLGSRLIGFLRSGQVFRRKPTERQFQQTLRLLASWGMKIDQELLRGAYFETRVVPQRQHDAAVKLLTIFAEHLAILSNQIVIQRDNTEPPMITKAKDYIRAHHTEDLSLPQVAQVANTSPFHFCKLFKQSTGLTFTKFLSYVRIESSKNLLINPQLRVSEVAYEVGFQSLTHFNRVFQKLLGQSPTDYRHTLQGNQKLA